MSKVQAVSLSELNESIRESINKSFPVSYHVAAEINELQESYAGHAYLDLIEKDSESENITAKIRATAWANVYRMIKPYFRSVTGTDIESGMKVLLVVSVEFHKVYGISLNIIDIDPAYTLGDMERKRLETVKRLEEDGVLEMNTSLEMPEIPKRIAVISSETAAGYEDFMRQLQSNEFEYRFETGLFAARMQGKGAPESVVKALDEIAESADKFDVVVIIRGGGSKADLEAFNDYWMAVNIAQFPLPVVTGIGHERDQSVADMVAHTSLKTPTAVAEFFIERFLNVDKQFSLLAERLLHASQSLIRKKQEELRQASVELALTVPQKTKKSAQALENYELNLKHFAQAIFKNQKQFILEVPELLHRQVKIKRLREEQNTNFYYEKLAYRVRKRIASEKLKLQHKEEKAKLLSPERILDAGYAYVLHEGKIVKDGTQLKSGSRTETVMKGGKLLSETIRFEPKKNKKPRN